MTVATDINLDFARESRTGLPEAVYGCNKSPSQLRRIADEYAQHGRNLLITRCTAEQIEGIPGEYNPVSRTHVLIRAPRATLPGSVGFVYAGTSDLPVVLEGMVTMKFLGARALEFGDCGVAGIHRVFEQLDSISACDVLICFAGFEGALPSVLGGLSPKPIIAVPVSNGYGVAEQGHAALHSMLASCAPGVCVMNIDNGFGAAMAAARILQNMRSV